MHLLLRVLLLICLLLPEGLYGQDTEPPKWGRVDLVDRGMRAYPADPSAPALVLSDYRIVGYSFEKRDGKKLRSQRHRRVKYFESSAYSRNPVRIEWRDSLERISDLRALLHLPNGKVEKLRQKDFRVESLSNGRKQYVLDLPQVPAGAIVEYRYLLNSADFDHLPVHYFQGPYPVRRSEYRGALPDWYEYAALATPDKALLTVYSEEEFLLPRAPYGYTVDRLGSSSNYFRLVAESLPALTEEPYTNNVSDHIPQLRAKLRAVADWPSKEKKLLHPTWPQLADSLRKDPTFGLRYFDARQIDTVRRALAPRLKGVTSYADRARLAYRAITEHLTWDGTYSTRSARSPDAVWAAGSGTSGELNLLLIAVLRELGIPASPVLVGKRGNGVANEILARHDQFDHVLVLTDIDDRPLLLDVGDGYRPVGLPRPETLNNRGWLVLDEGQRWIDLRVPPSERVVTAKLSLDTTGNARGELVADLSGYYAAFAREQLQRTGTTEGGPLVAELSEHYADAAFDRRVSRLDAYEAPLRITLEGELRLARREGDRLSFVPLLLPALTPDLITATPRQLPLDMPFPWAEQFRLVLDLPPGYTVETLPAAVQLSSPDGGVQFAYTCLRSNRQLVLDFDLKLLDTFYSAKEFEALRELFYTAIERQEARLVLRRE